MPIDILMPALSPTMEKGNLARWLKKEGDRVKPGDVIAEIETDKATMEVESIDEGILAKIHVAAGTADVPVNQLIAVLAAEGEDVASAAAGKAPAAPPAAAPAAAAPTAAAPTAAAPIVIPPSVHNQAPTPGGGSRPFSSPLARRLAKAAGIDLAAVSGTGPHGRIVARDVEGAKVMGSPAPAAALAPSVVAAQAPAAAAPAPRPAPPVAAGAPQGATVEQVKALFAPDSYKEIPLDGMRRTIAKRLLESKQTIPHFYLTLDTDLDALMRVRETLNDAAPKGADGKPAYKLSVNDFVIKALALALQRVPDANACWAEDRILKFNHSDVGVAVAIPGGLFTPVIRKAEQKSLSTISSEMKDYATRARARKLQPHEYQGGSTAVSNLGMFGIREFAAVINPPHASILAVGGGEARAVVRKGEIVAVQQMTVTLSCDHRVVDGALGAELLQSFRSYIENPMSMLV